MGYLQYLVQLVQIVKNLCTGHFLPQLTSKCSSGSLEQVFSPTHTLNLGIFSQVMSFDSDLEPNFLL